jgi:hypothetical protein
MIAHYKLDVTELSAITADLGTVNAGTIYGVNISGSVINAGSGQVTLNDDGLTLSAGQGVPNRVKWTNNAFIYGSQGYLGLNSPEYVTMDTPNGSIGLGHGAFWPVPAISLGLAAAPWGDIYSQGVQDYAAVPWDDKFPVFIDGSNRLGRATGYTGSMQVQTPQGWRSFFFHNGLLRDFTA